MAQFNPGWLDRVPPPPSGREIDDPIYRSGVERLNERNQTELASVWYWTNRLAASLTSIAEDLREIRYTFRLAVGFIEELDGAFGVIVYTEVPRRTLDDQFVEDVGHRELITVIADNQQFPVVVRNSIVEPHWCTAPEVTAPTNARATCWVKSLARGGYEGWLMPRHAVVPLHANVSFSDGGTGRVVDHWGQCIDSVVVSSTQPPLSLCQTKACWPITAAQQLLITDAPGSHCPVSVLDVDLNLGLMRFAIFPVRFSTDWTGRPGHSGAFIVEPTKGEPAGSYLGIFRPYVPPPRVVGYVPPGMSAPPPLTGYAQACFQLEEASGLEFYV